jgi:uncharacterized protein YceK
MDMKKILLVTLVLLSGCSSIDKVKEIWPRAHDPALASSMINLSVKLDAVNCKEKTGIEEARKDADWLNRYTEFRNDPQKVSTKGILDNLEKAKDANEAACNRWLNLSKTRIKIIQQAWSGR